MQSKSRTILAATFLLFTSVIDQASAASVNYTQDRRNTFWNGSRTGLIFTNPSTPYADFNTGSVSNLSQNSSLGPDGFTASGTATSQSQSPYGGDWHTSKSVFDITFSVANDTAMTLSTALYIDSYFSEASVYLYRGDNTLIKNLLFQKVAPVYGCFSCGQTLDYSAILSSGDYRLVATAIPANTSAFSLTASFVPVPVPAAAWLLASGLVGMIGLSSKRCRC